MKLSSILMVLIVFSSLKVFGEDIDVNFRNLEINDFIKMVGKITGTNILISRKIKGKINFIAQKKIKKENFIALANDILEIEGYTMIYNGEYYRVVKNNQAVRSGLKVVRNSDDNNGSMITVIFQLERTNASIIKNKIKSFLNRSAKAISFKKNNLLVISAHPRIIKSIEALIKEVEKDIMRITETIILTNVKTKNIFGNVRKMVKIFFTPDIKSEEVIVMENKTQNSITLIGKQANVNKVKDYIINLDTRRDLSLKHKMYVIPMNHVNVEDIEKILTKLIPSITDHSKVSEKVLITSDLERNVLIVLADKNQIINIRETISKLDIEKSQVYIKVKIIEINENLAEQIGVRYGFNGGKITSQGILSLAGNTGASALNISPSLLQFLNEDTSQKDSDGNIITTTKKAFKFSDGIKEVFSLGLTLDLLKTNGAAQIKSTPSILCINNKESSIYVGRVQSILAQSQQSTQSSSNIINSYSREEIGIKLKVKPRFTGENKVYLDVEAEIEDILPGSGSTADKPTTTKRTVISHVTVKHAETIILGGLIKKTEGKGSSGLPILSDIPLLGKIFQTQAASNSKINVVIYLTPYIIKSNSDFKNLRKNLSELDDIQNQYNKIMKLKLEELRDKKKRKRGHKTFNTDSTVLYPIENKEDKYNNNIIEAK